MTKQEVIKQAYGEYWERVKNIVDENGWIYKDRFIDIWYDTSGKKQLSPINEKWFRPEELTGLENNNGWVKINSEKDLPTEDCMCHIMYPDGQIDIEKFYICLGNFESSHYKHMTHYRIISAPPKPVY